MPAQTGFYPTQATTEGSTAMRSEFTRRDFHKLSAAAFGGIVAGSLAGCNEEKKAAPTTTTGGGGAKQDQGSKGEEKVAANDWLGEKHVCRGLNACKNQGASKMNDCAGQGTCATKEWHHTCSMQNGCKYQGGCGKTAGTNSCKQTGNCHVPLMEDAWKTAHAAFEAAMKKAGKPVGKAPEPEKEKS